MSIKYIFYHGSRPGGGKIVKTRQRFEPVEHVPEKGSRQNLQIRDQGAHEKTAAAPGRCSCRWSSEFRVSAAAFSAKRRAERGSR